jgi:hypothetical protein
MERMEAKISYKCLGAIKQKSLHRIVLHVYPIYHPENAAIQFEHHKRIYKPY